MIKLKEQLPPIDKMVLLFLNNGEFAIGKFCGRSEGFINQNHQYIGNEHPMDFESENCPYAWQFLPNSTPTSGNTDYARCQHKDSTPEDPSTEVNV